MWAPTSLFPGTVQNDVAKRAPGRVSDGSDPAFYVQAPVASQSQERQAHLSPTRPDAGPLLARHRGQGMIAMAGKEEIVGRDRSCAAGGVELLLDGDVGIPGRAQLARI